MMTLIRRDTIRAIGGACALLLAACGGTPAAPSPAGPKPTEAALKPATVTAPTAPAGKRTGTFWFNQPIQQKAFEKILERFHTSQDRVQLQVVLVPINDIPTKLATAIAGGDPPDAVRLGGPVANSLFIQSGHAAALDQWDPKIGTYDFLPPSERR